jgi:hypothetical protein
MKVRHLLFCVLLAAFAASGCIFSPDDDSETPDPGDQECATAKSADEVIQIFREVYAGRDLDCYRELLSEEYLFIAQDGSQDNYDEEIAIADRMFNELAGDGNIVISDITIDLLRPEGVWTQTPANDPNFGGFPESQYRQYTVDFSFHISGQNLRYRVQGPVLYFVQDEGEGSPDFKLLGMVDSTYGN